MSNSLNEKLDVLYERLDNLEGCEDNPVYAREISGIRSEISGIEEKIETSLDMKKGFETEYAAHKFADKVRGTVEYKPLPDYMGMIPYWIVRWKGENEQ
ncbi:MAG: hypothetical protein HDR09_12795 [Lachnospiraceae bacterium]|nr:hypothetical protein [Lachnospiraceae bacterium]